MSRKMYNLPPPSLINTDEALEEMLSRLMTAPAVAVDTESNSLYAYTERVCLIQFSVPGEDYLVDPFAFDELRSLGALFAEPAIEKVFHAAEYDVMVLRRDYHFEFANLFDTMIASRIVGWSRYGLGNLLQKHFGVQTDKRMQRTNWGRRPLSSEQLEYARLDTHYLLALRDKLSRELMAQGRTEEARAASTRVAQSEWTEKSFDPDGFWGIKGARDLDESSLAVLRALYVHRERRAQALDRPPFKVMNDRVLVALSRQQPRSLAELGRIRGIPRRLPPKQRREILSVIEKARTASPPRRPRREDGEKPDQEVLDRYEALRAWRKRRSQKRGVEPDVVLSNRALHTLARHNPTSPASLEAIDALNEWERREYGREIVTLLRRYKRLGSR
jgi:ribonuclease D